MARRRDERTSLYFPSLLDRLREDDRLTSDWSHMRNLVLRDLSSLLNARSHFTGQDDQEEGDGLDAVRSSVVNFGLPDVTGRSMSPLQLSEFTRAVEQAIKRFEPRLSLQARDAVRVVREDDDMGGGKVTLQIRGELKSEPFPEWLCITTEIDVETGRCAVSATSEERDG